MENEDNIAECSFCNSEIKSDDDFCPGCGSLFIDADCTNHAGTKAAGACVICCEPFCDKCGYMVNSKTFLCNHHSDYEIYGGMVKVFSALDEITIHQAKSFLEQENLHPVLFNMSAGLGEHRFVETVYGNLGNYRGHIADEIKLMIPFQELITAEEILKKLQLIE